MTGSWLVGLPELMIRPHNAQTVLPFSFLAALLFAGRSPLFRWRAIDTGIESRWRSGFVDFSGVGSNSAKSFFLSSLNQENNGAAKLLAR